jgi:hypothetical protein
MIERASPAQLRKALEIADTYKKTGLGFVPMPVANSAEFEAMAAQVVESAWRSRSMVPVCPHCSEAIFATDGLGRSQVNKQMAERRRAAAIEAHKAGEKKP